MIEVLRFEFRQLLGGRKKWFVVFFLSLPILLTILARTFGGLSRDSFQQGSERAVPQGYVEVPLDLPEFTVAEGRLQWREGKLYLRRGPLPLDVPVFEYRDGLLAWNGQWVTGLELSPRGAIFRDGRLFVHREFDPAAIRSVNWSSGSPAVDDLAFDAVAGILLFVIYPQTLCILMALLYGASLLAAELEAKTITYLFTRPLSRATILRGKFAAVVLTLSLPLLASLAISWGILGMPGGVSFLASLGLAALLGLCAYNALFLLVGMLAPTRAMVFCLVYAVLMEFLLSFLPALVNTLTISYHLRSIAVAVSGFEIPPFLERVVAGDATASWLGLGCIVLVSLWISCEIAKRREYVVTEQV